MFGRALRISRQTLVVAVVAVGDVVDGELWAPREGIHRGRRRFVFGAISQRWWANFGPEEQIFNEAPSSVDGAPYPGW